MRTPTLLAALLAAGLTLAATSRTAPQDDEPTPLQAAMQEMMGGQRAMRRLVRDPAANVEGLVAAASAIQRGALAAYSLPPAAPEGEDPHRWRIGYQRQILRLLDTALECELAARAGDAELLKAAYARLGEIKAEGHDTYQVDERP